MNELVSVIVPVYNSEKYIYRCIKSILGQSYKNIEVVVVNDGSTDNSRKIVETLAEEDTRVKLINKCNEGVSVSRTTGIRESIGKYICFVDSDDFIQETMIERLHKEISKTGSQLSMCGYFDVYSDKDVRKISFYEDDRILSCEQYLEDVSLKLHSIYYGVLWNKIYSADIIRNNKLEFRKDISLGEDVIFNLDYMMYVKQVSVINEILYNYCHENGQSLTNNKDPWYQWHMARERYIYYIKKYKELGMYDKCKKELNNALSVELIGPTYYIVEKYKNNKKDAINKLANLFKEQIVFEALYESNIDTKFHRIARICIKKKRYKIFYLLIKLQTKLKSK